MILSRTAIYALRALAVLTNLPPGDSLAGSELSARTDVPPDYLAKVMRQLAKNRIVRAQRGRGGGFSLMRAPSQVTLAEVLAAVDTRLDLGHCAFRGGRCDAQAPCMLHAAWSRFQSGVGDWARETTLADLEADAPTSGAAAVRHRRSPTD